VARQANEVLREVAVAAHALGDERHGPTVSRPPYKRDGRRAMHHREWIGNRGLGAGLGSALNATLGLGNPLAQLSQLGDELVPGLVLVGHPRRLLGYSVSVGGARRAVRGLRGELHPAYHGQVTVGYR